MYTQNTNHRREELEEGNSEFSGPLRDFNDTTVAGVQLRPLMLPKGSQRWNRVWSCFTLLQIRTFVSNIKVKGAFLYILAVSCCCCAVFMLVYIDSVNFINLKNIGQFKTSKHVFVTSAPTIFIDSLLRNSATLPAKFSREDILHFNVFSEASLQRMKGSEFRIYYESDASETKTLNLIAQRYNKTVMIDIFTVIPWLQKELTSPKSHINKFYRENPAIHLTRRGRYSSQTHERDKGLFRKVLAIWHTLKNVEKGAIVIWLDTDTFIHKSLDWKFDAWVGQYEVAFMPFFSNMKLCEKKSRIETSLSRVCKSCSETGIVAYIAGERTIKFLEDQVEFYRLGALRYSEKCMKQKYLAECQYPAEFSGGICDARVSLNDIAVFGHVLDMSTESISAGYFATGCRTPEYFTSTNGILMKEQAWYQHAVVYKAPGFCPSGNLTSTIAPFNILEYITHYHYSGNRISGLANKRKYWSKGSAKLVKMGST